MKKMRHILERFKRSESRIGAADEGFSLIEVLMAVAIFSIGILAVGSMQITATKENTSAGKMTIASNIAQNQMEQLISLDYDDSANLNDANGDGEAGLTNNTSATADHTTTDGQYNIYWNVAEDEPISNTKTIEVIVSWQGGQRQVSLTTVMANTM